MRVFVVEGSSRMVGTCLFPRSCGGVHSLGSGGMVSTGPLDLWILKKNVLKYYRAQRHCYLVQYHFPITLATAGRISQFDAVCDVLSVRSGLD